MRAAVVVFPGSNCDRDMAVALERASGTAPAMVWHKDADLPAGLDLVALPGGFSHGDYLRAGAIAARAPIMAAVRDFAARGGHVLGVCNGFQVLTEAGLLPGALLRNGNLKFICRDVALRVETSASPYTALWNAGAVTGFPVAHHDGAWMADAATLAALRDADRIAFTYEGGAPNGSTADVAGILSENRRVLGLMPHPERAVDPAHGGTGGAKLFEGLAGALAAA